MNEKHYEVCLIYKRDDSFDEELVKVKKRETSYEIADIPFFSENLAVGDLIDVEEDEGQFYFLDLLAPSGHSTVQMVLFRPECRQLLREKMQELSCKCDDRNIPNYLAIDIPTNVDYSDVRSQLDHFEQNGFINFKEACLSDKHRTDLKE